MRPAGSETLAIARCVFSPCAVSDIPFVVRHLTPILILANMLAACCVAPSAWARTVRAGPDTTPPRIFHDEMATAPPDEDCVIRARIEDDAGVFEPAVLYRWVGGDTFSRIPLLPVGDKPGWFEAVLPAAMMQRDFEYFIEAFDEVGNGPARFGDESLPVVVRVWRPGDGLSGRDAPGSPGEPSDARVAEDTAQARERSVTPSTDENEAGFWLGVGVSTASVLLLSAAGLGAFWWYARPDPPSSVRLQITAPTPVSSGGAS